MMPGKKHLPGLDLLRALAISLVLCYHLKVFFPHPPSLDAWVSFGWTGVDLFFVLSGFLITSQLLVAQSRTGIDLKAYFIKRAFRILPAYWLLVAAYFLLPSWREVQSPAPLWKFLSFSQNLGLDTVGNRSFSHAWSLCIEEQFYLALPLLLVAVGRGLRLRTIMVSVGTLMLLGFFVRFFSWSYLVVPNRPPGIATWTKEWATWIYYPTQCRLDGLLVGVLIASLFHYRPQLRGWSDRRPSLFLFAGVVLFSLGWFLGTPMTGKSCALFGYPVISLAYGAFLIAAISSTFRLGPLARPVITWLAILSYGIYLSHKMVIHLIQNWLLELGLAGNGWPMFFCLITACVLVGLTLHLLLERPAFKVRDKLLARLGD